MVVRGVGGVVMGWINGEINRAGVLVNLQRWRPSLAAVRSLKHAALAVRAPQVADRRDVNRAHIRGIDDDARNRLRVAQAHVLPLAAAVLRFIDAVAPR